MRLKKRSLVGEIEEILRNTILLYDNVDNDEIPSNEKVEESLKILLKSNFQKYGLKVYV